MDTKRGSLYYLAAFRQELCLKCYSTSVRLCPIYLSYSGTFTSTFNLNFFSVVDIFAVEIV